MQCVLVSSLSAFERFYQSRSDSVLGRLVPSVRFWREVLGCRVHLNLARTWQWGGEILSPNTGVTPV